MNLARTFSKITDFTCFRYKSYIRHRFFCDSRHSNFFFTWNKWFHRSFHRKYQCVQITMALSWIFSLNLLQKFTYHFGCLMIYFQIKRKTQHASNGVLLKKEEKLLARYMNRYVVVPNMISRRHCRVIILHSLLGCLIRFSDKITFGGIRSNQLHRIAQWHAMVVHSDTSILHRRELIIRERKPFIIWFHNSTQFKCLTLWQSNHIVANYFVNKQICVAKKIKYFKLIIGIESGFSNFR